MRILFISSSFYPAVGGVEKHVYEVSQRLVDLGHSVDIVTEYKSNSNSNYQSKGVSDNEASESNWTDISSFKSFLSIQSIRVFFYFWGDVSFWKKFRIWKTFVQARTIIKSYDVVHIHDVFVWYLPLLVLLPRKKVFVTFHGYETKFPLERKAILIRRVSNFLATGSINVGDYIEKWYGTRADHVTYGGITGDTENKKVTRPKDNKYHIVFIGRMADDTSFPEYLTAILKIQQKYNARITFIGEGPYRSKAIRFGEIYRLSPFDAQYDSLLNSATHVFASSYLSIFEGLVRGKPVYALYSNALKGDYLKLSPFKNYIMITNNVHEMVKLNVDVDRVKNGFNYAQNQSWNSVVDLYLQLWKK